MAPTTKEAQRAELHKTIWRIANDLRGSVDGWDFKAYSSHLTRCRCVWCFLGYYPRFCCGGGMSCCIIFTGALE